MRVVAGRLGGRTFDAPHSRRTHPMSDKVRGALFNILGDVEGLTFLDAYTGTGAIAIEAISRGAASGVAIDIDKGATTTVVNNLKQLGIVDGIRAVHSNVAYWSQEHSATTFDVVVADPPYDQVKPAVLAQLATHANPGGVVVFSLPPSIQAVLAADEYELLAQKSYGDATLVFYRRIGA